jgi:hypothetical protein
VPFPPTHILSLSSTSLPVRTYSALFSNFVEDISNNKKDIVSLLVDIRIAIQRDS